MNYILFSLILLIICNSIVKCYIQYKDYRISRFSHRRSSIIPKSYKDKLPISSLTRPLLGLVSFVNGFMKSSSSSSSSANAATISDRYPTKMTNSIVGEIDNIRQKRLGSGDIIVSEMALGTQRWVSGDYNSPDENLCFEFMDRAILKSGINLIDTAEQYPIPSTDSKPEGLVETTIGKWLKKSPGRREKVVIATKITGGRIINKKSIALRCENSLRRLGTDYIDIYQLHWPARYTPQANWGQSLQYHYDAEPYYLDNASFEEVALAMGDLIKQGKIRGYGLCNDNAFGITKYCEVAKRLGVPPPVSMQNDFSLIDRRAEENGVAEASSPFHENVGFMSYNALAGGVLSGKYMTGLPATYDNPSFDSSKKTRENPRGRHDEPGWSRTLYRYRSGPALSAVESYSKLANQYGMSLVELSLRWTASRRLVTTTLLGTTSMKQLEENIKFYQNKKALPDELLWEIDRVHMRNRLPIFASDRVGKDWYGEGEIGERIP